MTTASPSPVIAALRGYAADPAPEEERSIYAVMRALMEHAGYYVPMESMAALGTNQCEHMLVFSENWPRTATLNVFTDEERARFAAERMRGKGIEAGMLGG